MSLKRVRTMASEMSEPYTFAPLRARGIDRDPVPQPASHMVTPFRLFPSQFRTLSTVTACPSLMSICTCIKWKRQKLADVHMFEQK